MKFARYFKGSLQTGNIAARILPLQPALCSLSVRHLLKRKVRRLALAALRRDQQTRAEQWRTPRAKRIASDSSISFKVAKRPPRAINGQSSIGSLRCLELNRIHSRSASVRLNFLSALVARNSASSCSPVRGFDISTACTPDPHQTNKPHQIMGRFWSHSSIRVMKAME